MEPNKANAILQGQNPFPSTKYKMIRILNEHAMAPSNMREALSVSLGVEKKVIGGVYRHTNGSHWVAFLNERFKNDNKEESYTLLSKERNIAPVGDIVAEEDVAFYKDIIAQVEKRKELIRNKPFIYCINLLKKYTESKDHTCLQKLTNWYQPDELLEESTIDLSENSVRYNN